MTEHVQLELIAASVILGGQIITIWRADIAARSAAAANRNAEKAVATAEVLGAAQSGAIVQVHDAVNGGMAAQKKEIGVLKEEVARLKALLSGVSPKSALGPESRLEEIRGQQ